MSTETQRPEPVDDDLALKLALQRLPAPGSAAQTEALQARVLAQWHAAPRPDAGAGAAGGALMLAHDGRARWLAAAGLLAAAALLAVMWWLRADAAFEELLQPDLLSLIAAGEL